MIIMIVTAMPFTKFNVNAATNPYPTTQDVDGDGYYEVPCTRFAWQQVYDNFGIALPAWGNAVNWWQAAKNAGYATGSTPQAGSIAVWSGGTYGHVAYVTSGSGNTFTVNEGGRTDLDTTSSHGVAYGYTLTNAVGGARPYDTGKTLLGFIYPTGGAKWYDSMTPKDIGTGFYANIIKRDGWATLGIANGNVEIVESKLDGTDVWYFERLSDGSYVIYNCANGKVLDVHEGGTSNGSNVYVYQYGGVSNQQWYIYGPYNGQYVFRPKHSDKVLDVSDGGNSIGTNVQIWTYSDVAAQQFSIYGQPKAGNSTISMSKGDSATKTTFSWSAATNITHYNVRIFTGTSGNLREYKSLTELKTTSAHVILPAGYYEVYVESRNGYSYSESNVLKFNISEHAHTFTYDGKEQTTCKTCGESNPNLVETIIPETTTVRPTEVTTPKPSTVKPTIMPTDKSREEIESESLARQMKEAKIKINKVKNLKGKKIKLTWKISDKWKYAGYQIMYARNKKFTKGKKVKNVSWLKTSKTVKGLKKNKTYYFRIRPYAYSYDNYKKVYGKWSKVKQIKIEK